MKLRILTAEEDNRVCEVAVHQVIEDCEQDHAYLRGIAETYVDLLGVDDRLNAISEDDGLLVEALGFNPFERGCPHNIPESLAHGVNIVCLACEPKCNSFIPF